MLRPRYPVCSDSARERRWATSHRDLSSWNRLVFAATHGGSRSRRAVAAASAGPVGAIESPDDGFDGLAGLFDDEPSVDAGTLPDWLQTQKPESVESGRQAPVPLDALNFDDFERPSDLPEPDLERFLQSEQPQVAQPAKMVDTSRNEPETAFVFERRPVWLQKISKSGGRGSRER